jgi:membrane protease YdiL (CAAX protease family)
MTNSQIDRRDAWGTISIFMVILICLSAIAHFAIIKLAPISLYVWCLMLCPAIAALVTQKIKGRKISSLPWRWGEWRYNIQAYFVPVVYVSLAYILIWTLGFGSAFNLETIAEWSDELGLSQSKTVLTMIVMIGLLATIQFIKSLGSIVGEELGWRGFLVWELRKIMPFGAICVVSGLIWSIWHYPVIIVYGGGDPLFQLACFTLMITSMSVILTYFTFMSGSLWPAVMFHAAHNIYVQKIFMPLTIEVEGTKMWTDEYGLMIPIVVTLFALYYWRKAKVEGL